LKRIVISGGKSFDLQADQALPTLTGIDGTVIDGRGAHISPGADASTPFVIGSSNLTIQNFTVTGFGNSIDIAPRKSAAELHDIVLDHLDLTNGSGNINISGSGGTVHRVRVSDSRISGIPGANNLVGINIVGQSGSRAGLVDGVSVTGTWFGADMLERVQIVGIQAVAAATATGSVTSGSQVRNVSISRNTFSTCPDPCVLGYASLALGGQIAGAGIKGVSVTDNVMPVNGSGIVLIAGYSLAGLTVDASTLTDVVVSGNVIRPADAAAAGNCVGISLAAAYTDFNVGRATQSTIRNVLVANNRVQGCKRGLLVSGTAATEEVAGSVQGGWVSGVRVEGNTFDTNKIAVQIAGVNLTYTRAFGHNPTSAGAGAGLLEGNRVTQVRLERNAFTDNGTAVLIAGSAVQDSNGGEIVNNSVADVLMRTATFTRNQVNCRIVNDVREASVGVDLGNAVTGASCGNAVTAPRQVSAPNRRSESGRDRQLLAATGPPHLVGLGLVALVFAAALARLGASESLDPWRAHR
jgi:hypothetical protein